MSGGYREHGFSEPERISVRKARSPQRTNFAKLRQGESVSSIGMPNTLLKTNLEFGNGIHCYSRATQELPRKSLPKRANDGQSHVREKRSFAMCCLWRVGRGEVSHHFSTATIVASSTTVPQTEKRTGSPTVIDSPSVGAAVRKPVVRAGRRPRISSCVITTSCG